MLARLLDLFPLRPYLWLPVSLSERTVRRRTGNVMKHLSPCRTQLEMIEQQVFVWLVGFSLSKGKICIKKYQFVEK